MSRNWVRLHSVQRKSILLECWHNPDGDLGYFLRFLSERFGRNAAFWASTAGKISVLAAGLGKMMVDASLKPEEKADLACISGDFSGVLAGLYLKRMGFPVEKVVCCCNENSSVWELVHLGSLRTDGVCAETKTPRADTVLPEGLEHLLFLLGGSRQAMAYAKASYAGQSFTPSEELLKALRQNLYVSVVSDSRMAFTAAGILQTAHCVISPYDAMCVAGVQDYRAKCGENRLCLLLSEWAPGLDAKTLADALGIPEKERNSWLGR